MNKSNVDNLPTKGETTRQKSLTHAVLGVPKSHGVKLSLMTSEDKKEFLQKLEEWRKARREKLAAKILAKQKLIEKPKPSVNLALSKTKYVISPSGGMHKSQDKESVFERLYKNNGKPKKTEMSNAHDKIPEPQNISKSVFGSRGNPMKFSECNVLSGENLRAKARELVPGEHLINLASYSCGSETSKDDLTQKSFKQQPKASDSHLETVSHLAVHKNSKVESVQSKNTGTKNLEMNKSSKFAEEAFKNFSGKQGVKVATDKTKIPLRRSISMLFRQKTKTENIIRRSLSAKNLHEVQAKVADNEPNPKEQVPTKAVSFATPKVKPVFSSTHLRSKLEDWLKVNGHSLEGYRHLRCFGIDNDATFDRSNSPLENSHLSAASDSPLSNESNKENVTPPTLKPQVDVSQVENWLKELRVLISNVKYPSDRCEEWLAAIRKKYPKCSQLPMYWECLAALNESKGDVKSAIEDYERAIIKGGQVDSVDNSLAQLFDKMVIEQKKSSKSKTEKGIDPKNIFKSTIIKFALQQKTLKKLGPQIAPSVRDQLYIVTPVRRSSRIQTPVKSKDVASLESLTPDVKSNLTFKPNESLLEAD